MTTLGPGQLEGRVIVNVTISLTRYTRTGEYAARIRPLGLTAYGMGEDQAIERCKDMFTQFVEAYRRRGKLGFVLQNSGLKWDWNVHSPGLTYKTSEVMPGVIAERGPALVADGEREFALAA